MTEQGSVEAQETGEKATVDLNAGFVDEPALEAEEESTEDGEGEKPDEDANDQGADKELDESKIDVSVDPKDAEIASLRSMNRSMKRSLDEVRAKQATHDKALQDNDLLTAEEGDAKDDGAANTQYLGNLLAVMEMNPKYEDVNAVVTQDNVDKLLAGLASAHIAEHGGELVDVITELEEYVWSQSNPYKLLYDKIRPALAPAPKSAEEKEQRTPAASAPSLASLPAGAPANAGGWSMTKIDGMSEEQLTKVPADVYNKYMAGQLPE